MSRKLCVCWMFLWITTAADVTADYVLSDENITWIDAKTKTNFATPNIHVNNLSISVNITINLKNKEAWVGYYKKVTAFAYIGCGLINTTKPTLVLPLQNNTPGLCYSMCNKAVQNVVGLNKDKCFCLSDKPTKGIYQSACDISPNGTWVAGGGDGYMSIYERIKTDILSRNCWDEVKCLVFSIYNSQFWKTCKTDDNVLCKTESGANATLVHHGYINWEVYVKRCFENKKYAIANTDIKTLNISQATGPAWTNVICSTVIYKYNEDLNFSRSQGGDVMFGYVTKHRNMAFLSFTGDSSKKLHFLQNHTQTTSTNGVTATSRGRQTTSSSSGKSSQINDTFVTSTEAFKSEISASGSDVSIPVSVSVVALFIVAFVVLIIILKRRGKLSGVCTKCYSPVSTSNKTAGKIRAETCVFNESPKDDYEQISELKDNNNEDVKQTLHGENDNYGHTYFVLEPGSRESHTDGDISDSKKDETEMNDDYNTLHSTKNFGTKADDTYDTTEKAAIKLKALRDTGCEKESPEKLNGNEEDTYNHISRNLLKINKTDNIYGVPDNKENDYGDVNNGCQKNLHGGDDTYSHLNASH